MKSLRWRLITVVCLTLWAIYGVAPSIIYFSMPKEIRNDEQEFLKRLPRWLPQKHMNLGLDLQGGVQLVLGVDTTEAVDNRFDQMGTELSRWASDQSIKLKDSYALRGKQRLRITTESESDLEKIRVKLRKDYMGVKQVALSGTSAEFAYEDDEVSRIRKSALDSSEQVIRSRVDKWGVTEPIINRRADNSILVQLPGFKDPNKARKLLGETAQLKFKLVDEGFKGFEEIAANPPAGVTVKRQENDTSSVIALVSDSREQLENLAKGKIPEGRELLFSTETIAGGSKLRYETYVVQAATMLSGTDVVNAFASSRQSGIDNRPIVIVQFTGPGGKRFEDVTGANIGKRMAIVLDDVVKSVPRISQKISGSAEITMGGSYSQMLEESSSLALTLKSGSIPAKIMVLEEREVGASLGPELTNQGLAATGAGLVAVLIFMVFYYGKPGVIACIALSLNGLFLLAMMAIFGFALTMPGLAGFILTLGMAVDANVLINERIRQELREGKSAKNAVENGFKKVFWTVFDANVTTLIAALVLLETSSSGPIRGFAVTLILGLIVSMYTALYCSKLFFSVVLGRMKSDAEIRQWLGKRGTSTDHKVFNFNFLGAAPKVFTIVVALSVGVIGFGLFKGVNWAVDFAGGTEMMVAFEKDVEPNELRAVAVKSGIDDLTLQALGGGKKEYLLRFDVDKALLEKAMQQNTNSTGVSSEAVKASEIEVARNLQSKIFSDLADRTPIKDRVQIDYVGPQVGKEMRNQGILSVIYAIIGVLLYIAFRFDSRFAPSAMVKMVLDGFIMVGYYVYFGRSFDLTAIAALLTVIGYSVNDVIVIYDRIRENINLFSRRSLRENINTALNETLGRSLNTSLVTVFSLAGFLIFSTSQIWNFAMAMVVGVIGCTISSTFVATSMVLWVQSRWKDKLDKKPLTMSVATGK